MDFVVVGFGFGALGVLLGLVLRDALLWRWLIPRNRELPVRELRRRVAWRRAGRTGGGVVALASAGVGGVAMVTLLAGASDRTGLLVVFAALTAALIAVAAWAAAYVHRYHNRPATRRPARATHTRSWRRARQQPAPAAEQERWAPWTSPQPTSSDADMEPVLEPPPAVGTVPTDQTAASALDAAPPPTELETPLPADDEASLSEPDAGARRFSENGHQLPPEEPNGRRDREEEPARLRVNAVGGE